MRVYKKVQFYRVGLKSGLESIKWIRNLNLIFI